MTVQKLIDALNEIEDKSATVYHYNKVDVAEIKKDYYSNNIILW